MTFKLTNTEIAFRAKSDTELLRSVLLFRAMQSPWMVKLGSTGLQTLMALRAPIDAVVKATLFKQFCGGETIEECEETLLELARFRVGAILDYSVEGLKNEKGFDSTTEEILRTIDFASGNPDVPFCVFKVTGIARFELLAKLDEGKVLNAKEMEEWKRARERFNRLCDRAHRAGVRIFVDAEETWIQDTIDRMTEEAMARLNRERAIVFTTVQMYRADRLAYLERLKADAEKRGYLPGLKLVRGAYMEKERQRAEGLKVPSPIHPTKQASDEAYDAALRFCVKHIDRFALCAGTHNENSTKLLTELMSEAGIERRDPRVHFAQLLGMSDHLTYNLADAGYNVAKYVPYGPVKAVIPYLIRRAEENTSIQGQTSRELTLLEEERRRRRQLPVKGPVSA